MDDLTVLIRHSGAATRVLGRTGWAAVPGVAADIGAIVAGRRGRAAPLAPLIDAADPAATYVHLTSRDGSFRASLTRDQARVGWLLFELDGAPLPAELGGPFRLFFPGVDACANLKDLGEITFATAPGPDTRPRAG